ncbi:MAG: diguanylate cyclase [Deltaproteobacteria bacterium]|nr:diguanylate cyclase [Deltaproteobacteria bacterium]
MKRILNDAELAALLEETSLEEGRARRGSLRDGPDQRGTAFISQEQRLTFQRLLFAASVDLFLARAKEEKKPLSVIKVRLEGLARLKEKLGQPEADRALSLLGVVLRRVSRLSDPVLVSDEDEFGVIAVGLSKEQALWIAERYRGCVEEAFAQEEADSGLANLRASIGLAVYPDDALEGPDLVRLAGQAAGQAAQDGGNRVHVAGLGRRRHPRFQFDLPIRLSPVEPEGRGLSGNLADLSLGGFSLVTDDQIDLSGLQKVIFEDPQAAGPGLLSARPDWRRAEALESGGHRLGFVFQSPPKETQDTVQALIWQRLRPDASF